MARLGTCKTPHSSKYYFSKPEPEVKGGGPHWHQRTLQGVWARGVVLRKIEGALPMGIPFRSHHLGFEGPDMVWWWPGSALRPFRAAARDLHMAVHNHVFASP